MTKQNIATRIEQVKSKNTLIRWSTFSRSEQLVIIFGLAAGIFGAVLSATAVQFKIPVAWFFRDHFHNFTGAFGTYFFVTLFAGPEAFFKFLIVFLVLTTGELCQFIGLYGGTFDWKDIVFYLLGALCGYSTEKNLFADSNGFIAPTH